MDELLSRSLHRKSDVVPLQGEVPAANESMAASVGGRRLSRVMPVTPVIPSPRNTVEKTTALSPALATDTGGGRGSTVEFPPVTPAKSMNSFAKSIISINRQQQQKQPQCHSRQDDKDEERREREGAGRVANQEDDAAAAEPPVPDPWGHVLGNVMRKTSNRTDPSSAGSGTLPSHIGVESVTVPPLSKRLSLTMMLKSREVKDLVKQSIVTNHWSGKAASPHRAPSPEPAQRSTVMEHWIQTAVLRHGGHNSQDDNDGLDDDDAGDGIKSGFDLQNTPMRSLYGRTLLLEESCRRAFAQTGENRTHLDLQALKAWFQMTKLKITTNFERLQPAELDFFCRHMALLSVRANEIVFRQGDDGDAMYILFAGSVEVKVARRILGEKVEVTVCELSQGDYFGERALLHDEPRAATIVTKTPCELVRITHDDYNLMLKQDQQEFFSRMQLAGSVHSSNNATAPSGLGTVKPAMLLPRSRSTLHQQTKMEYVNVLSKKKHTRTKADIDMLSEYLHTLKFFRGLPKTFARELCSVVDFLTLPPSAYVFREGEVGDLFYIIFSGSVDVIVSSKDMRGNTQQTKLINLTEGAHFGELALMKGHGIRSATVLTREETKFLVICEKDYNATLRRMQKEDLAKRVGALDRIPMFQTPEWTGDLLKEMSYVLSDQKLATGGVLFRQGEKAQQVYFVVRGELLVTKEIVDPVSTRAHVVFVERVGRDRVVGDDAAAGVNFNEVIYREVTVTASTPVELLVLSKYDVFHRLSRAARETLRAAAHSHVESVVYLDRLHKTAKWDAYKQKLLGEHLNHDRMRKLLPLVETHPTPRIKARTTPRTPRNESPQTDPDSKASTSRSPRKVSETSGAGVAERKRSSALGDEQTVVTIKSELVDANEFLLLEPVTSTTIKCFPPNERTLAQHVSTFNTDAPPRAQSRGRELKRAMMTERRRVVEMQNEGNPLAYFDLDAVQAQQKQQQALMRDRATSSRRLLLRKCESPTTGGPAVVPAASPGVKGGNANHALAATDATTRNAMNQFFQENFIFSPPKKPLATRREQHQRQRLLQDDLTREDDAGQRKRKNANEAALVPPDTAAHTSEIEAARKAAEQLCLGDFVVVEIEPPDLSIGPHAARGSPVFRIVRCFDSLEAATLNARSSRMHRIDHNSERNDRDHDHDSDASTLYALPKQKFALMPRVTRPRVTEVAQQRAVVGRFLRASPESAAASADPTDALSLFSSFQKLSTIPNEPPLTAAALASGSTSEGEVTEHRERNHPPHAFKLFASVSIVLSKRELETAYCDEPFLCVHALHPTEAEAMESALLMPPQALTNALLCILPVGEWLHFDHAYDWCVQIETDRRDKYPPSPTTPSTSPIKSGSSKRDSTFAFPGARGDTTFRLPLRPPRAEWEVEKEKAHRLHQFICTRMGHNTKTHDKDRRGGGMDAVPATGFTPRPTVSLDDKLTTLQDYLSTTSHSPLGGKNANAQVSILGKYRQMKRFGSIMRSRISTMSPPSSTASGASGSPGLTGVLPG